MAMTAMQQAALLEVLQARFEGHQQRHAGISWDEVTTRLRASPRALDALLAMESSGGEPDVIDREAAGDLLFCDCAPESPGGRRSVCYDPAALASRKENKPGGSAVGMAQAMGVALLSEAQYRHLQTLGEFDTRTSSWIDTPPAIRALGGALFCDRRYGQVFVYHNGASSYYAARGFRTCLRV